MTNKNELLDELSKGVKNPDDLFGKEGLSSRCFATILLQ